MRITKMLLGLVVGALAVVALSATASADRGFITTDGGDLEAQADRLRFEGFPEGAPTVTCKVILRGSLHNEVLKAGDREDRLIGYITAGSARLHTEPLDELCDSSIADNDVRVTLDNFPWHITYESFSGNLPEIDTITVQVHEVNFVLFFLSLGTSCGYEGDLDAISNSSVFTGATVLAPDEDRPFDNLLREGPFGFLCPSQGHISEESFDLSRTIGIELI
jgi:hypothetical protein